jgi:uncharacterized protein YjgD (DUF1641 family)
MTLAALTKALRDADVQAGNPGRPLAQIVAQARAFQSPDTANEISEAIKNLAYEQRTANLIDLMQTDSFEDHDGRWGILNSLRADIFSQIIERLGL